ncbi:uncharacterized protein LOC126589164 isoform X2 [Malus sylvestris]|uniref:uncharacterized protein LOC126589164 isoform X2 n=1 Tax=Malus sylvestris TaxID=3752 RepID=UPI0021AC0C01|nr:uncharacterized protein LOC126589164 isoform X2 [Malus sylvestris]
MRRRFWTRNREGDGTGLSYSTSSPWNVLDPRGKNDLLLMECPLINRTHIFSERSVSPKTLGCLLGLNRLVSYFRNVVKLSLEVA